jgi:hypothetical protein
VEPLLLIIVVALAWFWYASARAHEQAVRVARRSCERHGQQLLDETVLLERLWPRRGRDGRVALRRDYSFEFSGEGEWRHRGTLSLYGGRLIELQLQLPSGTVYDSH